MNKLTIGYAIAGCMVVLSSAVIYAIIRLFVQVQRVDASILVINIIAFAGTACLLMYLTKKDKELEEEELFSD